MPNEKQRIDDATMSRLNSLLKTVDLTDITADSVAQQQELPDGYFICVLDKAELTVSKKGNPQVALQLVILDKGYEEDESSDSLVEMKKSFKNRRIYKYYPLTDGQKVQTFSADMLKFEDEPGHSILDKEAFTDAELIEEALLMLETMQIYVNVSNTRDDEGKITNTWYNLISWKRAAALGLPVE